MARSLLYDVAAAGKFIPEDLKTKALQGANANNISLQMAARNPDYYLPKNFEYDWNKYEQIAPRTAEALKDPVLMSIAGTKAAEFWGEQENNWKSITARMLLVVVMVPLHCLLIWEQIKKMLT